jgi:hypothetical protein
LLNIQNGRFTGMTPGADHLGGDRRHVSPRQQLRADRTVVHAGISIGLQQDGDRDPGQILVRHRRRFSILRQDREDAEQSREVQDLQEIVGEHARVEGRVRDAAQVGEQLVGKPSLAGHDRRMGAMGPPLPHMHDRFEPGLFGRERANATALWIMWVWKEGR